jgi:hypothetical protein
MIENIALLPGGFRPPHAGHYNMAKWLVKNTDANTVVVKVSSKNREGITRDISLELWDLYRSTDSDPAAQKLTILPSNEPSPVTDVYKFIMFEAPENSTVYLGLGEKDISDGRYNGVSKLVNPESVLIFFKNAEQKEKAEEVLKNKDIAFEPKGKLNISILDQNKTKDEIEKILASENVESTEYAFAKNIDYQIKEVPPQAGGVSGTQMRGFIKDGDEDSFKKFLPDHLTDEQKDQAWNLVSSAIIKEETTQGKTLFAFDLDDTLITSNSQVIIKNKNTGEITKLTPAQYATYVPKEEDELDFQEFTQLINPQTISKNFQDFAKILKVVSGKSNATAIILTARQPEVQTDVNAFLDQYNLDNIQIHAVGSSDPQAKAKVVQDYIDNGYDKIRFYDDAVKNVKAIQALELTNQGVDILAKKVAFNTGLSEMMAGTMNKQELAKHQKNLKKLNKVFRKQGDQMVPVPDYIKGTLTRKLYEDDPKVGTGKKPKGSGRRLYTDEDPTDTVKIKFSSRQDIIDTLNKASFKNKSHARQSQIINLIHQRVRAAYNRAKDPEVKKRLKTALEYAEQRKEASKKKTERLKNQKNEMYDIQSPIYRAKDVSDVAFHLGKIYGGDNPAKKKPMKETKLFSKEWWSGVINEVLMEGGAAGHMAHPFDLPNVTKGNDLIQIFEKAAKSLETTPGSVKIDGVNASIRLGNFDGKRQFVMDRGSKKELDIKGVTKDDLEARFGAGHGMIKAGGDVLDIFNEALKNTQSELTKLGLWDDPNIMFNMEYVTGKTNVQEYEKNFLAIHGLLKIEMKEVEGKRGNLTQRVTTEQPYNKADLQTYLNKLVPFAEKKGFEVYGSVPTKFTKSPDFNKVLNTQYTVEFTNKKETKSLKNWLKDVNYIPKTDRLKMNLETGGTKDVGALSKQVYFAVFGGENIEDLFDNEQDIKKAIQGAVTYLATEKLGDAILDVLDSPMGSVNNHEGVVIRDKSISSNPFKITGKFITGGVSSQFQQKENINESEEDTINFDIEDIRGYKVVLATYGNKIVGKLRLIPYPEYYQVENVLVDKDLRGMGIGKNLYLLARKELGKPIHSDKHRTPDAENLWKSLVKSGDAEAVKGGTYVMKEETNPPQYNVSDEIGTSMYTSDIRETKVSYDALTNDLTRQIYDILARYNEGDVPYGQAYEEDLELNFPTADGIEPLDATVTIIPKKRSIYAHEITGQADEDGIYIRIEFLKDELPGILNDMMSPIKGVIRHELEHIGQHYVQKDPKTRDVFKPSYVESQTFEEYTLKPEEINAYVKELNRIRKTQNISFRDALKNYFREYKDNFRSEEGMRTTMKAWLQKAKDLKIID